MERICFSCLRRLSQQSLRRQRRPYTSFAGPITAKEAFAKKYFWGNNTWLQARSQQLEPQWQAHKVTNGQTTTEDGAPALNVDDTGRTVQTDPPPTTKDTTLPHRCRRRRPPTTSDVTSPLTPNLPPDASAQLSVLASTAVPNSPRARFLTYLSLSKPRLTFLIVLTTTASYSLYPVAITPFAAHLTLSPLTLLTLTTGTAFASASANALNMLLEPEHDAKMSRTRMRPLVRNLLSRRAALLFAVATGATGTAMLYYGVNPTVAFLGALNIALYAGVYTPLKRISVLNTWVGALVGGIPPLMGWAAAAGQAYTNTFPSHDDPTWRDLLFADDGSSAGGWLLAGLLFAWQFPHFWALAYSIRGEYAAAGYRMLVSSNIRMAGRSALRYSVAMFPICVGLSAVGVTGWWFVGASGVVNTWLVREAWRFWRMEGAKGTARGLFWASVWHLPILLVLAMLAKRGVWERVVWGGLDGDELRMLQEEVEEDEEEHGRERRAMAVERSQS